MSWQLLIWNIFIWSFTGLIIYLTNSSLWWLLLPALFTGGKGAVDLMEYSKYQEKEKLDMLEEELRRKAEKFNIKV